MPARNPMGRWETCPRHGTPFQDPDGCPDCARAEAPQPRHPDNTPTAEADKVDP